MAEADLHSVPSTENEGDVDVITTSEDAVDMDALEESGTAEESIGNGHDEPVEPSTQSAEKPTPSDDAAKDEIQEQLTPVPTLDKPVMATKSATGTKTATATVKKVLNSGTFGAGSAKPAASKTASAASVRKPVAAPTKPSPARASGGLGSSVRKTSDAPAKAAPRPSTVKAAPAPAPAAVTPASASRASPADLKTASPARPRASVSEGVKRAPLTARASLGGAVSKPTITKAPTTKSRTASSISSIREVKEDPGYGKVLTELQDKLKETEDSLFSKSEQVAKLESDLGEAKAALEVVQTDVDAKAASVSELQEAKATLEAELAKAKEEFSTKARAHDEDVATLAAAKAELEGAKAAAEQSTIAIETLNANIALLEGEVVKAQEGLQALKDSHSSTSAEAAAAALLEHEALVKAQSDFATMQAETEILKASHSSALAEALEKIARLESQSGGVAELEEQIMALQKEKEDGANKVSELEIEILELKDSQETAEDEHAKALAQLKVTEEELAAAKTATEEALSAAQAKEAELSASADGAKAEHADALKLAAEEQAKVVQQLTALKADLDVAHSAHESAQAAASEAAAAHASALEEAEQRYLTKQKEFSDELQSLTAELESQESKYNAKVDEVKIEHEKLLQEAFERAKSEASEGHREDLNAVRLKFDSTTAQMSTNHSSALSDLKAEHEATIEEQSKSFEKQISKLNLELKATQDDLAKSKAAYEAAKVEIESLTGQRDDARAAAAAIPTTSPEQEQEIESLKTEISHTKDDLAASNEILALTKESISEMSNKHMQELEEAAKSRADEVTKLKSEHDDEITTFAKEKSELQIKLSDLEGELATVRAALAAASEQAAPKSNGTPLPPQSPSVTKEELTRMHEAHNLKIHDLQADHEKAIKALAEKLEKSQELLDETKSQIERKDMEIKLMENDQEESNEQITSLKEDLERLHDMLKAKE